MDLTGQKIVIAHPSADLYGSDRMMLETLEGLSGSGADVVVVVPNDGPLLARVSADHTVPVIVPSLVLRKSLLSAKGSCRWSREVRSPSSGSPCSSPGTARTSSM
ncbi:hypothetical protein MN0502_10300 [Arthrobacter sp. MN05-02]|nr:hypothetical protein MN0502_10300 [Arthrobacter sp. MN05-02]